MTGIQLTALAPHIVLAGGATLMLLAISFVRRGPISLSLTLAVLVGDARLDGLRRRRGLAAY